MGGSVGDGAKARIRRTGRKIELEWAYEEEEEQDDDEDDESKCCALKEHFLKD